MSMNVFVPYHRVWYPYYAAVSFRFCSKLDGRISQEILDKHAAAISRAVNRSLNRLRGGTHFVRVVS